MNNKNYWLKLDNAAKIFPAVSDNELSSVFRLSVVFKEKIHVAELQSALAKTYKRFPYFNVHLNHGFFWHYLEEHKGVPRLEADIWPPLQAFRTKFIHDRLYRVLARGRELSLEMMHSVSDGAGGLMFLNTLIFMYLKELKYKIDPPQLYLNPSENPKAEEIKDSYIEYFTKEIPPNSPKSKAWSIPFNLKQKPRLSVIQAEISTPQIKQAAKSYKVSITTFLTAVYFDSLQEIMLNCEDSGMQQKLKIIRMQIPVNLRAIFPSKSMRNFTLFVLPEIDMRMGRYDFDDIIKIVYHYMQLETYPQHIKRIISRNVGSEKLFYVRAIPLFIKDMVLAAKHKSYGNAQYSGVMTNLGQLKYPDSIAEHIDYMSCLPPPPNKRTKINCSIVSFKDKMIASFCNISDSNELEQIFLSKLSKRKITVKIINRDNPLNDYKYE